MGENSEFYISGHRFMLYSQDRNPQIYDSLLFEEIKKRDIENLRISITNHSLYIKKNAKKVNFSLNLDKILKKERDVFFQYVYSPNN